MPYDFSFGSRSGQSSDAIISDDEIEKHGGCWLLVQGRSDLSEVYVLDREQGCLEYDLTLGWGDRLAAPYVKSKDPCPYCGSPKTKVMQRGGGVVSGYETFPKPLRGLHGLGVMIVQCKCIIFFRTIDPFG